jgi:prolipoprotein diacylglyceryltransferase
LLWRRARGARKAKRAGGILIKPGSIFSLMFVLYGIFRFLVESLRDDNPFEFKGMTVSQIISIGLIVAGVILLAIFHKTPASQRKGLSTNFLL